MHIADIHPVILLQYVLMCCKMPSDFFVMAVAPLLWHFCCLFLSFPAAAVGRGRLTCWGQCVGLLSCSALFHEMIQAATNMLLYAFPPIAFASKDKL